MTDNPVPIKVDIEDRPLSPMQLAFVREYVSDPSSVTKAAKRAGYSIQTANEAGGRLMMDPRVKRAIQIAQDNRSEAIGISSERVLQELAKIAFANPGDEIKTTVEGDIDLSSVKGALAEVIVSTTTGRSKYKNISVKTVKIADKITALRLLGQHIGMFKEQVEVSGKLSLAELIDQSYKPDIIEGEVIEPDLVENSEELLKLEDKTEIG